MEANQNVNVTLVHQGIKALESLGDWVSIRRRDYLHMAEALKAEGKHDDSYGYKGFANAHLAVLNEIARNVEALKKADVQVWKANVDLSTEAAKKWEITVAQPDAINQPARVPARTRKPKGKN